MAKPAISLWWSLFWRLGLLTVLLSLVLGYVVVVAILLFAVENVSAIFWRPTAAYWIAAVLCWISVAASPRFFGSVLWGDPLALTPLQWGSVGRATSIFFLVMGVLNVATWRFGSTAVWIDFKLYAPLPLLACAAALTVAVLRKSSLTA